MLQTQFNGEHFKDPIVFRQRFTDWAVSNLAARKGLQGAVQNKRPRQSGVGTRKVLQARKVGWLSRRYFLLGDGRGPPGR